MRVGDIEATQVIQCMDNTWGDTTCADNSVPLIRRKATASLGHMSPSARRRVLRGAFAVPKAKRDAVAGKHFVLVDDVLTTGATAEACARMLKRAGAARVDVLVFTRVVRSGHVWEGA